MKKSQPIKIIAPHRLVFARWVQERRRGARGMRRWDVHSLLSVSVYSFPSKEDGNPLHKCSERRYTWIFKRTKTRERNRMAGSLWEPLKNKKSECVCLGGGVGTAGDGTNGSPWQCSYRVSVCVFNTERGVMGGSSMGWNRWCILIDRAASRPNKEICGSRPLLWTSG